MYYYRHAWKNLDFITADKKFLEGRLAHLLHQFLNKDLSVSYNVC